MKIPKRLLVGHYVIDVEQPPPYEMDRNDVEGRFQGVTSSIEIRNDRPSQNLREVLLHESLHAVLFCSGLKFVLDLDQEKEEQLVAGLASPLLALLRDNPKFVKFLLED